eukprot:XP_022265508.1 uncharacterized protein LOC111092319 [Canis lupus familiaris]
MRALAPSLQCFFKNHIKVGEGLNLVLSGRQEHAQHRTQGIAGRYLSIHRETHGDPAVTPAVTPPSQRPAPWPPAPHRAAVTAAARPPTPRPTARGQEPAALLPQSGDHRDTVSGADRGLGRACGRLRDPRPERLPAGMTAGRGACDPRRDPRASGEERSREGAQEPGFKPQRPEFTYQSATFASGNLLPDKPMFPPEVKLEEWGLLWPNRTYVAIGVSIPKRHLGSLRPLQKEERHRHGKSHDGRDTAKPRGSLKPPETEGIRKDPPLESQHFQLLFFFF